MRVGFTYLLLCLLCFINGALLAEDEGNFLDDISSGFKQFNKAIKKAPIKQQSLEKSEQAILHMERQIEGLRERAIGISLKEKTIMNLAQDVHKILVEQAKEKKNQHSFLLEEIGTLEVLYYLVDKTCSNQSSACAEWNFYGGQRPEPSVDTLFFSEQINLPTIDTIQFISPQHRLFFYRAKSMGEDVLIQFEVKANGDSTMSYYTLHQDQTILQSKSTNQEVGEEDKKNLKVPEGRREMYGLKLDTDKGEAVLLKVRDERDLPSSSGVTFNSDLELSTKKTELEVGLKSNSDKDIVKVSADPDQIKAETGKFSQNMPYGYKVEMYAEVSAPTFDNNATSGLDVEKIVRNPEGDEVLKVVYSDDLDSGDEMISARATKEFEPTDKVVLKTAAELTSASRVPSLEVKAKFYNSTHAAVKAASDKLKTEVGVKDIPFVDVTKFSLDVGLTTPNPLMKSADNEREEVQYKEFTEVEGRYVLSNSSKDKVLEVSYSEDLKKNNNEKIEISHSRKFLSGMTLSLGFGHKNQDKKGKKEKADQSYWLRFAKVF